MSVLLSAQDLRLAFGGVKAADGINLDVMEREFLAIIGPNGAGKTTFINMTTGHLTPQGGSIRYEGRELLGMKPRAIVRLGIARSFQLPQLFTEHTVLENAAMAVAAREGAFSAFRPLLRPAFREEAEELLNRFGLMPAADRRADALNEGTRKLTDIAMAVAMKPRLLLMDEPTSGVAAVFVEHDMDVVGRIADRVAVWGQGKIAALGPPEQILNDPAVQRDVIGIRVSEVPHAAA
jgi:branched-chain amino acid transport system ATP-binding protein